MLSLKSFFHTLYPFITWLGTALLQPFLVIIQGVNNEVFADAVVRTHGEMTRFFQLLVEATEVRLPIASSPVRALYFIHSSCLVTPVFHIWVSKWSRQCVKRPDSDVSSAGKIPFSWASCDFESGRGHGREIDLKRVRTSKIVEALILVVS